MPGLREHNGGAPRRALKISYYDEFANAANKTWLIKPVFAENETSTLIGPPGSLKSALLADVAVHYTHARADNWRGFKIKKRGGVIIFAFERADLTRRRIEAYKRRDNLPAGLPIAVVGEMLNLMDPRCVDEMLPAILETEQRFGCEISLAAFDTYNKGIAFGGGDEDKARDQNRALSNLRRLQDLHPGLHNSVVGHTGKDESRGARGSNALPGDSDTQIQISRVDETRVATVTKANDRPEGELLRYEGEVFQFGLDEDGDPTETFILSRKIINPLPTGPSEPKLTKNQQTMFSLLYDARPAGLTLDQWNDRAREVGIGKGRRSDLYDIRSVLKDRGLIREYAGMWKVA